VFVILCCASEIVRWLWGSKCASAETGRNIAWHRTIKTITRAFDYILKKRPGRETPLVCKNPVFNRMHKAITGHVYSSTRYKFVFAENSMAKKKTLALRLSIEFLAFEEGKYKYWYTSLRRINRYRYHHRSRYQCYHPTWPISLRTQTLKHL